MGWLTYRVDYKASGLWGEVGSRRMVLGGKYQLWQRGKQAVSMVKADEGEKDGDGRQEIK